jgi:hypothetical protein
MLVISACSSSSGILKLGPDTYTINTQVVFGPNKASESRAAALKEAEQFCTTQGRELLVDGYTTTGHAMAFTGDSEVRFKCLQNADTDLKRPSYQSAPNTTIEIRKSGN